MDSPRWGCRARRGFLALLLFSATWVSLPGAAQAPAAAQRAAAAPATQETVVAPGVVYRHLRRTAPDGQPWSIHVLEIDRGEKSIVLRAIEGHGEREQMQRALPSAMGASAARRGSRVLAVINGDFDLGEPYLGMPIGLSVTSGRVWTSGKPGWPALGLAASGEPAVGVPEMSLELHVKKGQWTIAALNRPPGIVGEGLRLYTREYRATLESKKPLRAVVIGRVKPALPLRVDRVVRGIVLEVHDAASQVAIPPDVLVLVEPEAASPAAATPSIARLRRGQKVKLSVQVKLGGSSVRDAIGGFPILVENGRASMVGAPAEHPRLRHPRTAACYNERKILYAVVDGRQPQLSAGMTLEELAELMVSLGCVAALNLDGGGSAVMAVALPQATESTHPPAGGQPTPSAELAVPGLHIVNSPSDGAERGRGNAWLVIRTRSSKE